MKMKTYRFKPAEIEAMKSSILTHCEHERTPDKYGNFSAWRLRLALEVVAYCTNAAKREQGRRYRRIALYESLTRNDMPAWA